MENAMQWLFGSGMAKSAADNLATIPEYKQYIVEAQAAGMPVLPSTDPNWMNQYRQMMGMQQPMQPQGLLSQ